ncbi:Hypothetical protein CINCED_3A016091 [Cinara cedri]|uniref:Carboxylesterase type B domain-containing protein n=1 Tax=Cinara cedri TaxID=506608 RepID=A0A5E4MGA3_9HEMI|nr:Hypothetical protein CINCED_3A016091 [Cinara cedri]
MRVLRSAITDSRYTENCHIYPYFRINNLNTRVTLFEGTATLETLVGRMECDRSQQRLLRDRLPIRRLRYYRPGRLSVSQRVYAKGLFNRAILQSGSAYCHWSYAENVTQKTSRVAEILGCPTSSSEKIVECLRSRPARKIAESAIEFMRWLNNPFSPFGPTVEPVGVEPRFLPDIPEKLIAYDVPVLMSVTQDEGYCLTADIISKNAMDDLNTNWNEYLPHLLDYNYTISNEFLKSEIAKDIKKFYFGDKPLSIVTITKMVSDRMFGYSVSKAAQNIASTNTAPVYFHQFGYGGKYSYFVDPTYHSRGSYVSHGDETMYVLKINGITPHDNEEDTKMIKTMVNIWASFIKTGVPDIGNSTTWLPVSKNSADPFKYIEITQDQTFEFKEESNYGNYEFWSSLPLTEFNEIRISNDINHTEL